LLPTVSTVSAVSGRYLLRLTGSAVYVLPRTRTRFGEHGFFYSGPAAWNTLPSELHNITDTSTFTKRLKSVLFDRAYYWLLLALLDTLYNSTLKFLVDWLTITPTCRWLWFGSIQHSGQIQNMALNNGQILGQLYQICLEILWNKSTFTPSGVAATATTTSTSSSVIRVRLWTTPVCRHTYNKVYKALRSKK